MKNLKTVFLSLLLLAFAAPEAANAQAFIGVPGTTALTVDIENGNKIGHIVEYDAGRVVLTPSGNLQLKTTFDLSGFPELIPEQGKKKITVARVAVRVFPKGSAITTFHYEAFDVNVIVDASGTASVVLNWQAADMMGD